MGPSSQKNLSGCRHQSGDAGAEGATSRRPQWIWLVAAALGLRGVNATQAREVLGVRWWQVAQAPLG